LKICTDAAHCESTMGSMYLRKKGFRHSEETKNKIRIAQRLAHKTINYGFKDGNVPWNKGKRGIFSKEVRDKISVAHKGK